MEHAEPNSPAEQLPIDEVTSLGSVLTVAREALGLSIEQVAAELRVELRFLEALEQDRLEVFSAPVFVKGYLRHLANRFGLQYEDLLARYSRQTDISDVPLTYVEPVRSADFPLVPLVIGGLVLLLAISAFWLLWVSRDAGFDILRQDAPVTEPAGDLPDTGDVFELPDRDVAAELPVPAAAAVPDTSAANQAAGTVIQVAIRFDEDSWTEASDGNGDSLYYALGRAGTTANFEGTLPISFTLGNPPGVQMSIADQPYLLPTPTGGDTLIQFVVAEAP